MIVMDKLMRAVSAEVTAQTTVPTAHEDAPATAIKSAATSIQILVQNGAKQLPAPTAKSVKTVIA